MDIKSDIDYSRIRITAEFVGAIRGKHKVYNEADEMTSYNSLDDSFVDPHNRFDHFEALPARQVITLPSSVQNPLPCTSSESRSQYVQSMHSPSASSLDSTDMNEHERREAPRTHIQGGSVPAP